MTSTAEIPYVDKRRYLWPLSALIPSLPLWGYALWHYSGSSLSWWLAPMVVYLAIPLLDTLIGRDGNNPPEDQVKALEEDWYYRICTFAYIPLQYVVFFWGCWVIGTHSLAWYEWLGVVASVGGVNGVGINTAHELGHKRTKLERWLSKIALAPVAYGHFFVEHNRGHHRHVSTPEDPASSRFGESFYRFLPRTMIGSLVSAWKIEKQRLERQGKSVWHWQNDNLQAWAMTVVLYGVAIALFGPALLLFLCLQAFYGASLLEVVNYVEHYGLKRQRLENGRYERVRPEHSWNSNHLASNLFLYQLQRHSDHHANPSRRYQSLRHFEDVPQLPSGYATMIVLAYFPPLWRAVMDKRVMSFYDGDLSKMNCVDGLKAA